jgi:hypothetical protein
MQTTGSEAILSRTTPRKKLGGEVRNIAIHQPKMGDFTNPKGVRWIGGKLTESPYRWWFKKHVKTYPVNLWVFPFSLQPVHWWRMKAPQKDGQIWLGMSQNLWDPVGLNDVCHLPVANHRILKKYQFLTPGPCPHEISINMNITLVELTFYLMDSWTSIYGCYPYATTPMVVRNLSWRPILPPFWEMFKPTFWGWTKSCHMFSW